MADGAAETRTLPKAWLEQARAQGSLQLVYQGGDRRLGLKQAGCGLREAALLRHHGKSIQVLEGDVLGQSIHFKMRLIN